MAGFALSHRWSPFMVAWTDTRAGRRHNAAVGGAIILVGGLVYAVGALAGYPLRVVGILVALFGSWILIWAYAHKTRPSGLELVPASESCGADRHEECPRPAGPPCGCACHVLADAESVRSHASTARSERTKKHLRLFVIRRLAVVPTQFRTEAMDALGVAAGDPDQDIADAAKAALERLAARQK
jgi:hypothetical protein